MAGVRAFSAPRDGDVTRAARGRADHGCSHTHSRCALSALAWPTFHGLSDSYSAFRALPGFTAGCLLATLIPLDHSAAFRSAKTYSRFLAALLLIGMTGSHMAAMWAIIPAQSLSWRSLQRPERPWIGTLVEADEAPGELSYSLYVSHFLVLEVLGRLTEKKRIIAKSAPRLFVSMLVSLLVCILVGWIIHRLVEDPARRKLRTLLKLG